MAMRSLQSNDGIMKGQVFSEMHSECSEGLGKDFTKKCFSHTGILEMIVITQVRNHIFLE
jgi:hypothetical protein